MLTEGEYDLKITAPDARADGDAIVEAMDVAVPAGANVTVVAHLDANGNPTRISRSTGACRGWRQPPRSSSGSRSAEPSGWETKGR